MFLHDTEGSDSSRWLLKALRESSHELESQLYGLDEDELRWRPSDDQMCLKEIAAHLRDCEEHFLQVLELISTQDEPLLKRFDPDALVVDRDYRDSDLFEVMDQFSYLRHCVANLLWSTAGEWERAGKHPLRGSVTMAQLVREQHEHDLEHLWEARRIKDELQGARTR